MKKLICAADVKALADKGQKVMYVEHDTIVTPAAKDEARLLGVELASGSCCEAQKQTDGCGAGIELDSTMIYQVLKAMAGKGLLEGILDDTCDTPYTAQRDPGGLKLVRGGTVKLDDFDTGNPNNKVYYQEVIGKDDSTMSAGFLTIENNSSFEWELFYEEIDIVLEGTLKVTLNGKTFTANKGDILYVPNGSKVTWAADGCAKLFYVTYPANWPDLMPKQ